MRHRTANASGTPTPGTALVTGASSGIGETFAGELAERGYDLVLVARRVDRLQRLADRLSVLCRGEVEVLGADLTDEAQLGLVERRLADPDRPVDLLVNNAGSLPRPRLFCDQQLAAGEECIRVNVEALVRLTHAALPAMVGRGRGGVLNVSSFSGFLPQPQGAVYAATKAFVTSFSETLHCEVRRRGVRVMAVCPGFTRRGDGVERGGSRRRMPEFAWLDRRDVVRDALAAMSAGRAVCVPGRQYQSALAVSRCVPRTLVQRTFEQLWAGP